MKTLPEHPNLDHLRQQAKDVLAHRRTSRPEATLGEAQAEVAEQHGFRTWAELKAEVERLRAGGRKAEAGLAAAVAEEFGLGEVIEGDLFAVERVWAGQNWMLSTDRGRWEATELFDWTPVSDEGLEGEVRLVEAAIGAGISAPRPVRGRGGSVVATVAGRRWRVHEHIALGPAPVAVTPELASVAGRTLGVLHGLALATDGSVTAPASASVQARWLSSQLGGEHWRKLADRAAAAGVAWADALERAVPALTEVAALCRDLTGEAVILSKRFMGPDSIRPGPNGTTVVLDWQHAGPIPPAQELGSALDAFCVDDDPTLPRSLMSAYREAAVEVPEMDLGAFTSAVSAGHNWLATRINTALTSDDAARADLAGREVPGLLAKLPTRRRFEAILEAVG